MFCWAFWLHSIIAGLQDAECSSQKFIVAVDPEGVCKSGHHQLISSEVNHESLTARTFASYYSTPPQHDRLMQFWYCIGSHYID